MILTRYIPFGTASKALPPIASAYPHSFKSGAAFAKKGTASVGSSGAVHLNLEKRSGRLCP
nr:hypothetical protein [Paenibacillus polymyxa]